MTKRASHSTATSDTMRTRVRETIRTRLEDRSATAFVHCGPVRDPSIRYCLLVSSDSVWESNASLNSNPSASTKPAGSTTLTANALTTNAPIAAGTPVAIAVDREPELEHEHERWYLETATQKQRANGATHPAEAVAKAISETHGDGENGERVLTPATIPHDAACYLERAGFTLASSDVLSALRATKDDVELAALERAQTAAHDGLERARSMLTAATVVDGDGDSDLKRDDGRSETETETGTRMRSLEGRAEVEVEGEDGDGVEGEGKGESEANPLTPADISSAVDRAVLDAGCRPVSTTVTGDDRLVADRPIEIDTLVRTPSGYHGRLVRTLVVDPNGGAERRAHVALTHAFRSVRTMAVAGDHTVSALEADLEAEIRAFGFGEPDAIDVQVTGIGLEPRERPIGSGESVAVGTTTCVDAAVGTDAGRVRLADVLVRTEDDAQWLSPASWSMRPSSE
ncbi:hypothetical protein [Natronosalvus rutilus]|uniref:Xaa-Pro aminopeptidase n=1 Tax=Natronosalvus rutilus TaxID=2953753 RepID=A0A9E7SU86_9EURY|nr:hypothetical protein [Natronosalvus rutilus]UTF53245.1 hypothetical protein NGM29_15950 [Natronosalvus rutilus]